MSDLPDKPRSVAPLVLARSLEQAPKGAFLHVDNKGQVRSPLRYRAITGLNQASMVVIVVGAPLMLASTVGIAGLFLGAAMVAPLGVRSWWMRKLQRAVRLLIHDRTKEARALLEQILASRLVTRSIRAMAEQNLGACYAREGDHERALEHHRISIDLHRRGTLLIVRELAEYAAIHSLVNLGHLKAARLRVEEKRPAEEKGDYLLMRHWEAELHVCMAEGGHSFGEDELHDCARKALGITTAARLLGLLAWAHLENRDEEQAWLLLHEAIDRQSGTLIERTMPRLGDWMAEHAEHARQFDVLD